MSDAPDVVRLEPGPESWLQGLGGYEGPHVHRVAELLPPGHDVYLRVFHAFVPWCDEEEPPSGAMPRWTWRELAESAGAAYGPTLMSASLDRGTEVDGVPMLMTTEGELDPVSRAALSRVLADVAPGSRAFFWFGLAAVVAGDEQLLYEAPVDAVEDVLERARRDVNRTVVGPELAWPHDRSWVVATDYDLTSTYVACSRELAARLAATAELEVLEVSLSTRIDAWADRDRQS